MSSDRYYSEPPAQRSRSFPLTYAHSGRAPPIHAAVQRPGNLSLMSPPIALPIRSDQNRYYQTQNAVEDDRKRSRDSSRSSSSDSYSDSSHHQRPPRKRHALDPSPLDPGAALTIATNQPLPQPDTEKYSAISYNSMSFQGARPPAIGISSTGELDGTHTLGKHISPMMQHSKTCQKGYFLDGVSCRISGKGYWARGTAFLDDGCGFDAISEDFFVRMGGERMTDLDADVAWMAVLANGQTVTPLGWITMVCTWAGGSRDLKSRFIVLPQLNEDIFICKNTRRDCSMRQYAVERWLNGRICMLRFKQKTPEEVQKAKELADAIKKANEEKARREAEQRAADRQRSQQSR